MLDNLIYHILYESAAKKPTHKNGRASHQLIHTVDQYHFQLCSMTEMDVPIPNIMDNVFFSDLLSWSFLFVYFHSAQLIIIRTTFRIVIRFFSRTINC